MPQGFFKRLREYYLEVAKVLRGEAEAASVFSNSTDAGASRERVYADFLRFHAPSKCNVFLGGFLFDENGDESHQLDIIVTTDTAPRFDFQNRDGTGKSFSPVEGTLGVASIKSNLNKAQLEDALLGIASIPPTKSLEGRRCHNIEISNYDDWPYKVVYATDGIKGETLLRHMAGFYRAHGDIPLTRRPHIIHVAGKYVIVRRVEGIGLRSTTEEEQQFKHGAFALKSNNPDLDGIVLVLHNLQQNAAAAAEILFSYAELVNKVNCLQSGESTLPDYVAKGPRGIRQGRQRKQAGRHH